MPDYGRRLVLFLVIGALFAAAGIAVAQVSANFDISWGTFHAGGQRQSTNALVQDATGQNVATVSESTNFRVESGFVAGIAAPTPTPTPTNTPLPTATNTPLPTATNTPLPTATNTPLPTATNTPLPTATNTPLPTATNTPVPTATNTPVPTATNTPLPTATSTATPTATNTPTATSTPTVTPTPTATATPPGMDAFEDDDRCIDALPIATDGTPQNRTFHREGDVDWIRFSAQANRTYLIRIENIGPLADAVVFLHDTCATDPTSADNNAFGSTITISWDSTKNGDYYLQLRQFDPAKFGPQASYRISITVDQTPPSAPTNVRCISINDTTLAVQWRRSPERDAIRYRVNFQSTGFSGSDDVFGAATTYYELAGLTPGQEYGIRVRAVDFSGNESAESGRVDCRAQTPADTTPPEIALQQPTAAAVFTTTASQVTISGIATDAGNNLSRAFIENQDNDATGNDFTLEGSNDTFRVSNLPLRQGDNRILVRVFDTAGNVGEHEMLVRRLGESPGAVIIIAGHNETFGLQTNIYFSTNRAYRIFRSAGFTPDDIYYLAPVAQDADGDGVPDTRPVTLNPAAFQQAITVWAKDRIGPGKPLFIYMMDHGLENRFCIIGCAPGLSITPDDLDGWLRSIEQPFIGANGVPTVEITIVYEACVSGSFIQREGATGSISRANRVIITSAGPNNNAYASAQGAYFSDAFFSCLADSGDLKACFEEGRAAVLVTGVNQTPMLDDNGDGVFNTNDGARAQTRFVTRFFSSVRPVITSGGIEREGANGVLTAQVSEGAEEVDLVWAAVFPPSFQEPDEVTLNLNVPVVRLEPVANQKGQFRVAYPNGFTEQGDYRIIFYAQDRVGLHAAPRQPGEGPPPGSHRTNLPLLSR